MEGSTKRKDLFNVKTVNPRIDKREGFDTTDLLFKDYELPKNVDTFFHFAAQCRINEAIANPVLPHKNNADGILSVLEFCRKHEVPKIVYASSSRVLSPERNPYVATKIYGEEMVKAYHDCYGLEYITVRPSTVYGPMFDETSRLINNWITAGLKGEELRIYGDKNKTLDFTYIDDFIDGIMALVGSWYDAKNDEYNISGQKEVNLTDVATEVIFQTGAKSLFKYYPAEVSQPQIVKVDNKKIEKFGYCPQVYIDEGIERMVKFYKQNPDAWKNYEDKGRKYYGK